MPGRMLSSEIQICVACYVFFNQFCPNTARSPSWSPTKLAMLPCIAGWHLVGECLGLDQIKQSYARDFASWTDKPYWQSTLAWVHCGYCFYSCGASPNSLLYRTLQWFRLGVTDDFHYSPQSFPHCGVSGTIYPQHSQFRWRQLTGRSAGESRGQALKWWDFPTENKNDLSLLWLFCALWNDGACISVASDLDKVSTCSCVSREVQKTHMNGHSIRAFSSRLSKSAWAGTGDKYINAKLACNFTHTETGRMGNRKNEEQKSKEKSPTNKL